MHVTIREDGSIDPPEAAYLLMTEYFQQRSGDVERDRSAVRASASVNKGSAGRCLLKPLRFA